MKSLPKHPNMEFFKKEAQVLHSLHQQGNVSCCDTLRQYNASFKEKTNTEILSTEFCYDEAQRIIAHEYGYSNWLALKHFIEFLDSPSFHGVSEKEAYHQSIVSSYNDRSKTYDKSQWHRLQAKQTVDYCPPQPGAKVLDIATGTGSIAFYAADLVGDQGSVFGIDLSKGMLEVCNKKLGESGLTNVMFDFADAENLDFPGNSFDRIYCCSAFFWMSHPLAALRHWFDLLKPNGILGFNAWPDDSFIWGDGARQSLRKYGINFTCHEVTGNKEKIR